MSGIYLSGIEMPQEGQAIQVYIDGRGAAYGWLEDAVYDEDRIAQAFSVPDHGRLIDADELYKRAKMRGERFNGRFDETDNVINALYIENFPTVIPADEPLEN